MSGARPESAGRERGPWAVARPEEKVGGVVAGSERALPSVRLPWRVLPGLEMTHDRSEVRRKMAKRKGMGPGGSAREGSRTVGAHTTRQGGTRARPHGEPCRVQCEPREPIVFVCAARRTERLKLQQGGADEGGNTGLLHGRSKAEGARNSKHDLHRWRGSGAAEAVSSGRGRR